MDNKYTFENIYQYFKDNAKIYFGSFILSLFVIFGFYMYSSHTDKQQVQVEDQLESQLLFSFILENEQGNIMNNSGAISRVFTTTLSQQDFFTKKMEKNFKVTYDDKSNSFEVYFEGDFNKSKISSTRDFLVSQIQQNKMSFFKNKNLYFINDISNEQDEKNENEAGINKKIVVLCLVVVIVLTLIFGTLFANYLESRKKVINQKFYLSNDKTILDINSLKIQTKEQRASIINSIIMGNSKNKIVIVESNSNLLNQISVNEEKVLVVSDLGELSKEISIEPEEILIICSKNKTTKIWYKRQIELARNSSNIVKIIYI